MVKKDSLPINIIVDKIEKCFDNMMIESSKEELLEKQNIILFRSAKEDILAKFFEYLRESKYMGKVHVIGRKGDERYISEYRELSLVLYQVDAEQKYTIENVAGYIKGLHSDAICFLYQSRLSYNHENLLEIISWADCLGYAISNQLKVIKLVEINKFLTGKKIYDALCEWFYI